MLLTWLSLALAADPAAASALQQNTEVLTLDNGLTVVLEEQHRADTITLMIHYGVGARDEQANEYGCAHLFEHLMFEGSKNVPGSSFDEWLTEAGGDNNAYTTQDETTYYMNFPSGALDLALFLESDRLGFLDAGLTQENLDNQIGVVLQERARGYERPNGKDWSALGTLQFSPDHPYGHTVIGTKAGVSGFSLDAVQDFWQRHYRASNATLVLVGDFEMEGAKEKVQHWFADVPNTGPASERAEPTPEAGAVRHGVLEDDVDAWTVYMSWPTVPAGHADRAALDIAAEVLSGGRGTRLDDKLYYNSNFAEVAFAYHGPGDVAGSLDAVVSVPKSKLKKAKKLTTAVVSGLASDPPSDAELERAKKAFYNGMLDDLETPMGRASVAVECMRVEGRPDCASHRWAAIEAVTSADVQRVANTWLTTDQITTLSVIPRGQGGALEGAVPVELP